MTKTTSPIHFTAKLLRPAGGGDWTFLRLPQDASDLLPTRSMVWVEGTINGFAFEGAMEPDSEGGHWLKVDAEWSKGAGAQAGAAVDLEVCPAEEPEPEVPEDLYEALSAKPAALAMWNSTTRLARRDWIRWLISGKRAETRIIRIEKMIDMLSKGKRRICCFDRSGMASKGFRCPDANDD